MRLVTIIKKNRGGKMNEKTEGLLYMGVPRAMLRILREVSPRQVHASELARLSGYGYCQCARVIEPLSRLGLVKKGKLVGRIVPIKLTAKGRNIADYLIKIDGLMGGK